MKTFLEEFGLVGSAGQSPLTFPCSFEKCALRYRELSSLVSQNMRRLVRLELWMVGGMAAIIGLLAKLAFWPG